MQDRCILSLALLIVIAVETYKSNNVRRTSEDSNASVRRHVVLISW